MKSRRRRSRVVELGLREGSTVQEDVALVPHQPHDVTMADLVALDARVKTRDNPHERACEHPPIYPQTLAPTNSCLPVTIHEFWVVSVREAKHPDSGQHSGS
jgi:hypothetical protein